MVTKTDDFAQPSGKSRTRVLCVNENDYICDYLSKAGHFSRGKKVKEERYYCEKIIVLVLLDNRG